MLGLAESSDGLDPTEDLLDSLAFSLTDGVARLLRGSLVDGAAAPCVLVLRYVRSHRRFPGAYPRNLVCHSFCLRPTSPADGGAAVGMNGELAGWDVLLFAKFPR